MKMTTTIDWLISPVQWLIDKITNRHLECIEVPNMRPYVLQADVPLMLKHNWPAALHCKKEEYSITLQSLFPERKCLVYIQTSSGVKQAIRLNRHRQSACITLKSDSPCLTIIPQGNREAWIRINVTESQIAEKQTEAEV